MKTHLFNIKYLGIILMAVFITSCTDDLDRFPTNALTNDAQFSTIEGYKQGLVGTYLQLSGSNNFFYRGYWELQELTTDEAVNTWGSHKTTHLDWSSDHAESSEAYTSGLYLITLCNNFIIEASPNTLSARGFSETDKSEIAIYVAEVRFIKAYAYWMLLDLYGNPSFPTEETLLNSEIPKQIKQADLFDFIESELKAIDGELKTPRSNEYGRADNAAVWSLLARLYLNAEVYRGVPHYNDAITYSKKVIDAGYSLESNHAWLMLGDNYQNTNEFIFTFNYDNGNIESWGTTNVYALGASGVPASINGMSASWNLYRVTPSIPALFPSNNPNTDQRAVFWTENDEASRTLDIESLSNSKHGYSIYKYRNVDRAGASLAQNNIYNNLSDIDFPVFRLAEMYLIYAEAVLRGGTGGDMPSALAYINKIRGRAYANNPNSTLGNINSSELTLNFILDEKAREMMWEGYRRTDLIRYNKFTTANYLWAWKGGVKQGAAVNSKYKLFPIPISDILSNPNLTQNPGY
ncbi:RagB/SusD family nutrient uptake outer membrane protein [Mariniflexile soesokkakense]|uniref:RagB/SusD family nutrient uptake outer membrane protein n=1 Tax=Mariniflexile soesokkakense TaxID=1343160 RepID=A0ABV0AD25_9FLAO